MPTYSYLCKDCGHAFDVVQSFSEDALVTCPECQGALRKKFGNVGVAFKGSGFYRTDSRGSSDHSGSQAGASTTASSDSSSGSENSSSPAPASAGAE